MSSKVDAPLSAYWVKFFKAAGFSSDVATRHAVVFSNNRIQPDMLPDLDKPSLKEMGITLMGDMIAILRYAKKVVEETTCERFLVDSNDLAPSTNASAKPVPAPKKIITKVAPKVVTVTKSQVQTPVKKVASKSMTVKKKVLPTRTVIQTPEVKTSMKRKMEVDTMEIDSEDDFESRKHAKVTKNEVGGYKMVINKGSTTRNQTILKKSNEQKRTVFDRLGDSSVTSTTNSTEGSTTFNITGLGKPVFKRDNNVFNRLGDKDSKREEPQSFGRIVKNGSTAPSHGILKNNRSIVSTTSKVLMKKPVGTMRADFERKNKVAITAGVKQLVTSARLASERVRPVSAKQRLGSTKQVTFNKIATVARAKKPDVFSRLGL